MHEIVRMENICGSGILKHARFNVYSREIVGLLGMNNSGKTELLNILAGLQRPGEGVIFVDDRRISPLTPAKATELGIRYIYKEKQLLMDFTVAQNILVLREKPNRGLLNESRLNERCNRMLEILFKDVTGIDFRAENYLYELNGLQRLAALIIKAISENARVIIIDEYLEGLTLGQIKRLRIWLLMLIQNLHLSFVFADYSVQNLSVLCDRLCVLRGGMSVGSLYRDEFKEKTLTTMMTGSMSSSPKAGRLAPTSGETILRLDSVHIPGERYALSLHLSSNETVGLCCTSEQFIQGFCDIFSGRAAPLNGRITLDDAPVVFSCPSDAAEHGIGIVSNEARLFPDMSLSENIGLSASRKFSSRAGLINTSAVSIAISEALSIWKSPYILPDSLRNIDRYDEKRVLISRAFAILPRIMIYQSLDKGLDDITYDRLIAQISEYPKKSKASFFLSANILNLIKVCSRICFVHEGSVILEVNTAQTAQDEIIRYYEHFCRL